MQSQKASGMGLYDKVKKLKTDPDSANIKNIPPKKGLFERAALLREDPGDNAESIPATQGGSGQSANPQPGSDTDQSLQKEKKKIP